MQQALKVNPRWLLRDKKKRSKTEDEEFLCKMQHGSSTNIQRTIISHATLPVWAVRIKIKVTSKKMFTCTLNLYYNIN